MKHLEKDSEKYYLYEYKAKVISMKILDQHLDVYSNKDETEKLILYFDENDKIKENEYLSLYFNLIGATSDKSKEATEKNEDKTKRIRKYIDDAVASGYISKEDIKNICRWCNIKKIGIISKVLIIIGIILIIIGTVLSINIKEKTSGGNKETKKIVELKNIIENKFLSESITSDQLKELPVDDINRIFTYIENKQANHARSLH